MEKYALWRDLAATARLPNLPTVVGNVTTAYLVLLALARTNLANTSVQPEWEPLKLACLIGAAVLLYLFGTFLNDAWDVDFDRKFRSDRPIVAGRLDRGRILNCGFLAGAAALVVTLPLGKFAPVVAFCLAGLILVYTWQHKISRFGPLWMGLCRAALVPLAGASVMSWWTLDMHFPLIWTGLAMGFLILYTVGISLVARTEACGTRQSWLTGLALGIMAMPFLAPILGVACVLLYFPDFHGWQSGALAGVCGSLGLAWLWFASAGLARGPEVFVSRSLAGFALVDAVLLLPVWLANPLYLALPLGVFLSALWLQRLAPAT